MFLMSREENMTYREIALRCGIGEKAVERHIHLTLKFLKKNLLLFILFSMLPE
ncbi:sigma factor-like helix-turn-helix DNA-binding protein [Bacteroides acidifaciens]|uniref:sigma factor-like helix-turn-helix DNA-binding protein n=1 Tax=Bacteroides acidifaciens TaxID=85831 RepID=UPI002575BC8B|nr:sigma factor-like helix-turn-helix DNA-binding protein [Bacteroides acidifaciens]